MENNEKVLIIDDDPTIRSSLNHFLLDEEIETCTAENAEDAIDIIKNKDIKIIIVDIRLPGMDGLTFIFKAQRIKPDIYFLIHTGSSEFTVTKELLDIGITQDNILYKPILDLSTLTDKINKILNA